MIRIPVFAAALGATTVIALSAATDASADVSRECRGVAAGVVAGMRAQGELIGQDAANAAVLAARRACAAALEGFDSAELVADGATEGEQAAAGEDDKDEPGDEPGVWELLTRDQELTKGNERLRRLRN